MCQGSILDLGFYFTWNFFLTRYRLAIRYIRLNHITLILERER